MTQEGPAGDLQCELWKTTNRHGDGSIPIIDLLWAENPDLGMMLHVFHKLLKGMRIPHDNVGVQDQEIFAMAMLHAKVVGSNIPEVLLVDENFDTMELLKGHQLLGIQGIAGIVDDDHLKREIDLLGKNTLHVLANAAAFQVVEDDDGEFWFYQRKGLGH